MCFSASLLPSYNTLENYFCNLDRQYDFLKFAIALNMEAWDTIVFVSSCNLSVLPFTARWRKRENELFWLRISLASARASSWWDRRREEFYIFMVFFFMRSFFLRQRHLADICSKWSIPLWKIELSDSSICYLRKNVEIFLPHVCRNNSFFLPGPALAFNATSSTTRSTSSATCSTSITSSRTHPWSRRSMTTLPVTGITGSLLVQVFDGFKPELSGPAS